MARINNLLREEIAELLLREVKDESLSLAMISITEVDTSPDLKNAKVYFSLLGDDEVVREATEHLNRAANFLRRTLIGRLDLRYTPRLEFEYDKSLAEGARIMGLIRKTEPAAEPETEDEEDG